jgi:hypothetical protein
MTSRHTQVFALLAMPMISGQKAGTLEVKRVPWNKTKIVPVRDVIVSATEIFNELVK